MRTLSALAVLGCIWAIPAVAHALDAPKVMQVAGPEPGAKAEPAQVAGEGDGDAEASRKPKLLLTTSVLGIGFSHSRPLGVDDGATVFEGRLDSDYSVRADLLSVRVRMELAVGGGSRLTGGGSFGLLGGVAGSLSPGKYLFARVGGEGFYRQRPWGYASMLEVPKVEAGVTLAPVLLEGPAFFEKLAIELALSGALAVGAWAADEDPSLEAYKRSVVPSFGGSASFALLGGSIRAEYLRAQSDVSLSSLRVRPCLAAIFFAACVDTELVQGSFARASGGELVERSIFSIGLMLGVGVAWWEPQVPKEL
jgi:hypothetical protein